MIYKSIIGTSCACLAAVSISANAALLPRLGGLAYYDTDADLTWLADANYAQTIGFSVDGLMTWDDANAWVGGLDVAGVTGWRLPDTIQPDASCDAQGAGESFGLNCTGSEMGNLFYNVLGNSAGVLSNTGPFNTVKSGVYWSATEYALNTSRVWAFSMGSGNQSNRNKTSGGYAWAVQSGDVGAAVVPIPAAVWLFGSGLLGLVGFARRK